MKLSILSFLVFALPSLSSAIELAAERDCRDDLWKSRIGSLISLSVVQSRASQALTGILDGIENDLLDFGGILVKADRVREDSVTMPKRGDLILFSVVGDTGHVANFVTVFDRVERGLLYGGNLSVPVAHLAGVIRVVKPGTKVFIEFEEIVAGTSDPMTKAEFTIFRDAAGSTLHFADGPVPLSAIKKFHVTRY